MMEDGRRNVLVGLFVLLGLVALGTLIVLFGQGPTWLVRGGTYPLHITFEQGSGISAGTQVTLKGLAIGRVESIDMINMDKLDQGVDVLVAIEQRFQLPLDTTARTTEPVLGQGRPPIEILPGPSGSGTLAPGATISGSIRTAMDSIFPANIVDTFTLAANQIGDAAEALTPVLEELKPLLEARTPEEVDRPGGPAGNLTSAMARLDASLRHFNEILGDPTLKSRIEDSIANLHKMSERGLGVMDDIETAAREGRAAMTDARGLVTNADQSLARMESQLQSLVRSTVDSLGKIDTLLDHLNVVGQSMSSGQGTVGRLMMDDRVYESLLITIERLSETVEEFRALAQEWREGKVKVGL